MPKHKYFLEGSITRGPSSTATIEFSIPLGEGVWISDGRVKDYVQDQWAEWLTAGYVLVSRSQPQRYLADIYPIGNLLKASILQGDEEPTGLPVP